ncbi:MAG: PD-(D/E)XK nuclease family protein [Erysipelotrichaceae bacterium]|nr:PD-(D/E)XK nuclease family protein [Erysipelotrichaceae bacterium]
MQKYSGLNSFYIMDQMIQLCLNEAKEHPFEKYIMIVDNKDIVERHFMKYTHYLVNIEILSWKQFLKQLQLELHLTSKDIISNTYFIYLIRHILNTEEFACFNNDSSYNLMKELKQLILTYDSYQINKQNNEKLDDFLHLYQSINQYLTNHVLQEESLFNHADFHQLDYRHLYIEANHLYTTQQINIIQQLDQILDITLFYYYQEDSRLLNDYYRNLAFNSTMIDKPTIISQNIFESRYTSGKMDFPIYQYHAGSMYQEVNQCVYSIYQKIVDEHLHYHDFMIIYSDNSYVDLLKDALKQLNMPHNLLDTKETKYETSYQTILKTLDHSHQHGFKNLAMELLTIENLNPIYINYLQEITTFEDDIDSEEMKEFFQTTFPNISYTSSRIFDCIQIVDISHAQVYKPMHIYFLGLNETVCPHEFKDTSLLLDEDILTLQHLESPIPPSTIYKLGIHQNDITKALTQPCLSLTLSYASLSLNNEELIASSLMKQLEKMLHPYNAHKIAYLPAEDYYILNGRDNHKDILNHHIDLYKETANQPSRLNENLIQTLYTSHMSVSQIETYNGCPFRYFMKYGLKIYPLSDNILENYEIGDLVHYILKRNINDNHIHNTIIYYLSQHEDIRKKIENNPTNQYFIEQIEKNIDSVLKVLQFFLKQSSFEINQKEMKIESDINDIHFKGIIDRYDTYHDYSCIIDYKSSNKEIDLNLAMQGFNIQMLLYLQMITKINQTKPGAVLYFNDTKHILSTDSKDKINIDDYIKEYQYNGYVIDDGTHEVIHALDPSMGTSSKIIKVKYVKKRQEYDGHILSENQFNILMEEIEKHIVKLYQNMMNGQINISPKGSDDNNIHHKVNPCRYCDYHSICSFDVFYNDYDLVKDLDIKSILGGSNNGI